MVQEYPVIERQDDLAEHSHFLAGGGGWVGGGWVRGRVGGWGNG